MGQSITFEFKSSKPAGFRAPDSISIDVPLGTIRYVPETVEVTVGPVFKPGQIVRVKPDGTENRGYRGRYGVVIQVEGSITTINIGTGYKPHFPIGYLEIIHEVP